MLQLVNFGVRCDGKPVLSVELPPWATGQSDERALLRTVHTNVETNQVRLVPIHTGREGGDATRKHKWNLLLQMGCSHWMRLVWIGPESAQIPGSHVTVVMGSASHDSGSVWCLRPPLVSS